MMRSAPLATLLAALLCCSCAASTVEDDEDGGPIKTPFEDAGDGDGAGGEPSGLRIEREGRDDAVLLRGTVLTPDGVIDDGEVLVVGAEIQCVDLDCSSEPDADTATVVVTDGVISPGLVDAHNHLPYNFLPEWQPPNGEMYGNRYEWSDEPSYRDHVAPYANHRLAGSHYCPAARWGELRALLHATTTVQGQSANQTCIEGGARNADHKHQLFYDHMRTTIQSPRDITDDQAQSFVDSFNEPVRPVTRLAVHMAEGYSGDDVTEEFDSFAGRDERDNRHRGVSLLEGGHAILIHSIALTDRQLTEARNTDAKIVWSPSSNFALYGRTAPIARILELGITVGIGPDWTLSGRDDMLGELRFAYEYGFQESIPQLTYRRLWEMATWEGADVVGLHEHVGRLETGYRADIAVFERTRDDPYASVVEARAENVELVLVDGQAYYGARTAKDALERTSRCELYDVCGRDKFLCVFNPDVSSAQSTLGELEGQLVDILEGNGFPAEEQYGRGDDLLPLADCQAE